MSRYQFTTRAEIENNGLSHSYALWSVFGSDHQDDRFLVFVVLTRRHQTNLADQRPIVVHGTLVPYMGALYLHSDRESPAHESINS
jgi:hypothetical protein